MSPTSFWKEDEAPDIDPENLEAWIAKRLHMLAVHGTVTSAVILTALELTPVNTEAGNVNVKLPTGEPEGTLLAVEKTDASEHTVTVEGSIRGEGAAAIALRLQHETLLFQAESSSSWRPLAGHLTVGSLDARYDTKGAATEAETKAKNASIPSSQKGAALGVAELTSEKKLPESELPVSVVSSSRAATVFAANLPKPILASNTPAQNGEGLKELEELLASEGNLTVVMPGGVWKANRGLTVTSPGVTIRGWGSTMEGSGITTGVKGSAAAVGFRVLGLVVTGITSTSTAEGQGAGIFVLGDDSEVAACTVHGCGGEHWYNQMGGIKAGGVSGVSGRRITLRGNRCFGNSTHGIYASGCDDLLTEGNYCYENGEYAFSTKEAEAYGRGITIGTAAAVNVSIQCNYLFSNFENGLLLGGGTEVVNAQVALNHAYKNNRGGFKGGHGLEIDAPATTITSNHCYENHNGISVNAALCTLIGNHCFLNREVESEPGEQGCGIKAFYFTGPSEVFNQVIIGNHCQENDNSGIFIKGESNFHGPTVLGNQLSSNGVKNNLGNNYDLFVDKHARGGHYEANATSNTAFKVRIEDPEGWTRANTSASGTSIMKALEIKAGTATLALAGEGWEIIKILVTGKEACEILAPEAFALQGRRITFSIHNALAEEMGALTFAAAYQHATFTTPKNGKSKSISFFYNGEKWVETGQSGEY